MALADQLLRIGPLNIPVWLVAGAMGLAIVGILQRTIWRTHRDSWAAANDIALSGVLAGFTVWKLTPLVTRFDQIAEAPSRLLYYPGGTPGIVAGLIIGVAVGAFVHLRRGDGRARGVQVHTAIIVLGAALGFGIASIVPAGDDGQDAVPEFTWLPGYEQSIDASKPTVVTAWATWCGPCTAQMPEIERFSLDHGADVNIVTLNLTATEPSVEAVRAYLEGSGHRFPVALDSSGRVVEALGISATPTTVVFDAAGRERVRRVGAVNADWFARRVLPLRR